MWYLKFRVKHHGCIYTSKTEALGVTDYAYPLGHTVQGNVVHLSAQHIVDGPASAVREYIRQLKREKTVVELEGSGRVFFVKVREHIAPDAYKTVYNPSLIYVAPVMNDTKGHETWQLASWDRAPLSAIIALAKSPIVIDFKLLEFRQKSIHDIYVASLLPRLSEKQLGALRMAVDHGYYAFPKGTDLAHLAKISGITKATFQEHLRRAEAKLIPFLLKEKFT